jgi:WD40 repeat protein
LADEKKENRCAPVPAVDVSDQPFQVVNMLKSFLPIAFGLLWLAGTAGIAPARAQTTAIPEVSANRVIQLTPSKLLDKEKQPVVSGVAIDPAGKLLAAVGDDHLVRLFDLQTGKLLHRLAIHCDWVKTAAFRPDGRFLATAGDDRRIHLWDMAAVAAGRGPRDLPGQLSAVHTLAYNPDGRILAVAGFADKVWLFDADQGQLLRELDAPGGDIRAIAFSPNGTRMAAAGRAGVVRLWDVDAGRLVADVQVSSRRICALAYSPDGKYLAAAGQQRIVRLLSAASGKPVADLPQRPGAVMALCFCGANWLASAGSGNVIHLWDLATATEQRRMVGHTGSITTLVLDQHTQTLISGSYDTTVRLWDVKNQDQEKVTQRQSASSK